MGVERPDAVIIGQVAQRSPHRVALGLVVPVADVAPDVLLLQLLEAGSEAGALTARDDHLWDLKASTQLRSCGIDDGGRQYRLGDGRQHRPFDGVGRAAPGVTAERRAAVVADLGASLDVRFAAHPGAARTDGKTAKHVVAERLRLVADSGPCCDGGHCRVVFTLAQNGIVLAGALVVGRSPG